MVVVVFGPSLMKTIHFDTPLGLADFSSLTNSALGACDHHLGLSTSGRLVFLSLALRVAFPRRGPGKPMARTPEKGEKQQNSLPNSDPRNWAPEKKHLVTLAVMAHRGAAPVRNSTARKISHKIPELLRLRCASCV